MTSERFQWGDMLIDQMKDTIKKKGLIKNRDRVVVCVSGGPDSVALLYLIADLQKDHGIQLTVAHLDHMLRGKQSAADANFVQKLASKLNVPCIVKKRNVKKVAKSNKLSTEEAAREVRYKFYGQVAEKVGADKIATGHTADDQAETVLMRFLKGAGSRGLSGIPYKRKMAGIWVIRPLLDAKRADIERYLKKHKIPSRTDASNLKTFYLRNRLRHILIPLLEKKFNPRIRENLNIIARNLEEEADYLNMAARRAYNRIVVRTKTGVEVNTRRLLHEHAALQPLIARGMIYSLKGDLKKITYKHWQEIETLLSRKEKTAVDLPDRIKVKKKNGYLIFAKCDSEKKPPLRLKKSSMLKIPGQTSMPELGVRLTSEIVGSAPSFKKGKKRKRIEYIDGDSIRSPLKIRTWHIGDRMKPLGMNSFKKLQDIFVDEKVPREIRDKVPLVLSGSRILWAVGIKLSEDYKINEGTRRIVRLAVTAP